MLAHFDFASTAPIPALQYPLTGPHSHHSIYAGDIDVVIPSVQALTHSAMPTFTGGRGHAPVPTAPDHMDPVRSCSCIHGEWVCERNDLKLNHGHRLDVCLAPAFALQAAECVRMRAQARRSTLFNVTHMADVDVHAFARALELPHRIAGTLAAQAAGPLTPVEETEFEFENSAGAECPLPGFPADESDDQTSFGPPSPRDVSWEGEKGAWKAQYWLAEMDSILEYYN
ncbi:hypothetical protein TRAPUB_3446 [Trametes pubescens]|uniref:Uncharacterized protein n=1 Tax=Trametes pubescens TaxID=154538 RepID=A0A1M2VDW0_TRAPU|nr:hypothetical protein TRAPUB_3446 [Trametes pubescens]